MVKSSSEGRYALIVFLVVAVVGLVGVATMLFDWSATGLTVKPLRQPFPDVTAPFPLSGQKPFCGDGVFNPLTDKECEWNGLGKVLSSQQQCLQSVGHPYCNRACKCTRRSILSPSPNIPPTSPGAQATAKTRPRGRIGGNTYCGDGKVQKPNSAGQIEDCDPPDGVTCDLQCKRIGAGGGEEKPKPKPKI